jgi:peptidoglycan/xylan/chitin deacetylase (PgdA/CDA1 family)
MLMGLSFPSHGTAAAPPVDNGAVIIMYHRFGEADLPSTSVQIAQFEAHIRELTGGGYTVLPVPEILAALQENRALPDRSIGITIDDAFASVYAEAWPRLKAAGLPFTLFVSTNPLDQGYAGYMTWDQLREMIAGGSVTVGHHSAAHAHMAKRSAEANRADIAGASARFREQLGEVPAIFAYPYGEYSAELRAIVAEAGFAAAFGQHSGAIGRTSDRLALPRYPFSETYADMDRFRLVANSLPLPVTQVTPADPLVRADSNPPLFGFSVLEGIRGLSALNCFASRNEATLERLGESRIEVRLADPLRAGRSRVNCTMPGPNGRWRWFGRQFYALPQ